MQNKNTIQTYLRKHQVGAHSWGQRSENAFLDCTSQNSSAILARESGDFLELNINYSKLGIDGAA